MLHVLLSILLVLIILCLFTYLCTIASYFYGDVLDAWERRYIQCPSCRRRMKEERKARANAGE